MTVFLIWLALIHIVHDIIVLCEIIIPDLNGPCYVNPGDINLGFLMSQSGRGEEKYCSEKLGSVSRPQYR